MVVQNPPVKGGVEPPVMSFSGVVIPGPTRTPCLDGVLSSRTRYVVVVCWALLRVHYMLRTPLSCSSPNYIA
jgi:hypothetical protein